MAKEKAKSTPKEDNKTDNIKLFCTECGNEIDHDDKFCSKCGNPVNGPKVTKTSIDDIAKKASETVEKVLDTEDNTEKFSKRDIDNNRAIAIIAYFGPLAFLPYFGQKNSKYAQFHGVNGMNLFVWEMVYIFLNYVIENVCRVLKYSGNVGDITDFINRLAGSTIPWFLSIPLAIILLVLISLSIIGAVYAACGKAKELPIIGKFKVIKK